MKSVLLFVPLEGGVFDCSLNHDKYWLIQITGTCTNECAAGMEQLNRSTYLKLRGKLFEKEEGKLKSEVVNQQS